MNPPQTPFLCLEHDEIREFLETDFSQSPEDVTHVLRIHDHELHISRHPIQPPLFTVAILSRLTNTFSHITSTDIAWLQPIATRLAEAVVTSYIEHQALEPEKFNNHPILD